MTNRLAIPRSRLPDDPNARHGILRDYFCDKDAHAQLTHEWQLELYWPTEPARHVDPRLDAGLRWWNTTPEYMHAVRRREGRVQFSLYDTWTLHSWSVWLERERTRTGRDVRGVTILHLDDHSDCMSPRLFRAGSSFVDAITGAPISLYSPATIEAAIESGAIGMGSFLTPFLHLVDEVQVRHLCQTGAGGDYELIKANQSDDLLNPNALRPSVDWLLRSGNGTANCRYLRTSDWAAWIADLPPWPILLHVDMDFFNNRYNGDSAWEEAVERFDPPLAQITAQLERLGQIIGQPAVSPLLADIAVAFVPGFFPAEFWEPSYEVMRQIFGQIDGFS